MPPAVPPVVHLVVRLALSALAVPALVVAGSAEATAGSGTVVFIPGDATSISDGKVTCVIGNTAGKGTATCSGRAVYDAVWAGTACDKWVKAGCLHHGKLRAVTIGQKGRPERAFITGLGGSIDVKRGQKIKAGKLTGKHIDTGGFRFTNAKGHGFQVTNKEYFSF